MRLHPEFETVVSQMRAMPTPPINELSPADARAGFDLMANFLGAKVEVASVRDEAVPGPAGDIPVRIYDPLPGETTPAIVFYHGGGFVLGGLASHDRDCRRLAAGVGAMVIAVDYRLAPEHRFPAAVDDAWAALSHVAAHADDLEIDPTRIAVAGDSAGGNLSAVVAIMARDASLALALQVLIYPTTDAGYEHPSRRDNVDDLILSDEIARWFGEHYVGPENVDSDELANDPRLSPLRASSHADLAPALIITAEHDPLRDEGEAYGRALRDAGVEATVSRYDGVFHGFVAFAGLGIAPACEAVDETIAALRAAFDA